jgi:hypothetical protein
LFQDFQRDGEQIPIVDNEDSVKCSMIRSAWAQASWSAIMANVIIACAIITVVVVQIIQGVSALQHPSTGTSFQKFSRVFPGMLICPLIAPHNRWLRNSTVLLSSFIDPTTIPPNSSGPIFESMVVVNTNADLSRSKCSNAVTGCSQYMGSPQQFEKCNGLKETYGVPRPGWLFGISGKQVSIQNEAFQCSQSEACDSVYPPQVGCIAYDHTMFPSSFPNLVDSSDYAYGVLYMKNIVPTEQHCNPMLEGNISSSDSSVLVYFRPETVKLTYSGLYTRTYKQYEKKQDFNDMFLKLDLTQQQTFPGLVALFYNPSQGIPKSLKFDENLYYSQNPVVSGFPSAILTSWLEEKEQASNTGRDPNTGTPKYNFTKSAPITAIVECSVSKVFASIKEKISGSEPSDLKANYSVTIAATPVPANKPLHIVKPVCGCPDGQLLPQITIKFLRSETLFLSEFITTSLLTTLSLVVSTSATIFAGRNVLQNGIEWISLKIKKETNRFPANPMK